jgi:hypothetical protein
VWLTKAGEAPGVTGQLMLVAAGQICLRVRDSLVSGKVTQAGVLHRSSMMLQLGRLLGWIFFSEACSTRE